MRSRASSRFWRLYEQLPENVRRLDRKNYLLWRANPNHPSLKFQELRGGTGRFSVRVGDHYRALGRRTAEGIEWVWIGSHEEYNKLLRRYTGASTSRPKPKAGDQVLSFGQRRAAPVLLATRVGAPPSTKTYSRNSNGANSRRLRRQLRNS